MKKIYKIKVLDKVYEVELQEVTETSGVIESESPKKETLEQVASSGTSLTINAPMNGTIVDIKVSVGDSVKKGDVVAILEAMKMETDILALADGKITKVAVAKGATVNLNDIILAIN